MPWVPIISFNILSIPMNFFLKDYEILWLLGISSEVLPWMLINIYAWVPCQRGGNVAYEALKERG